MRQPPCHSEFPLTHTLSPKGRGLGRGGALLAMTLILIVCIALASCKNTVTGDNEQVLSFHGINEPSSLDPNIFSGQTEHDIAGNLFEGLTQYHPKTLEPMPGAAERWDISEGGRVYTFHIRKDARWSDGTPVTAHDFVYSWERVLNPMTGATYAFMLYPIKNAEEYNSGKIKDPASLGFKAVDDRTLKVTLKNPTPYFLYITAYYTSYPVPKKIVEKYGDRWTRAGNMVGNGAFRLTEWVTDKHIIMEKNPNYWDAKNVRIDRIISHTVSDFDTALKKYMAGELDLTREVPQLKAQMLKGRPDYVNAPYLTTDFYRINIKRPPLNDKRVRKALAMAIDLKKLTELLGRGDIPWRYATPKGFDNYPYPPTFGFDPARARELLKEAGFGDPKRFPKITIHYNTKALNKTVAEIIQQMWKENLGVAVGLLNEEWKVYLKTQDMGNYDISRAGWVGDYPDPNTFLDMWISKSAMNRTGWENPQFDAMIEKASGTLDPAKRLKILSEAEAMILDETPMIPLFQESRIYMLKPYIKGFYPTIMDIHPLKWVWLEQ